jgi:hypothetical protein
MNAEKIINTLHAYDPEQTTVTIGGAAIAMHFANVGVSVPTEDVDVLCSQAYFVQKCSAALSVEPDTIKKLQIRYPYGEPHTRALSPILDIYPGDKTAADVLSFSASTALGGEWHPVTYEACTDTSDKLVRYAGFMFLSMAEVLTWTAKAGRGKDIHKVNNLLPLSLNHQLISPDEYLRVMHERDQSAKLREQYPHRYFARVEP